MTKHVNLTAERIEQEMQHLDRLHDQRIISLDEKNARINSMRKREGLEPLNEYGHSHDAAPLQFGKLDLQPGSYLVVKVPPMSQEAIVKLKYNLESAIGDAKVLIVPNGIDLSVLTVPEQIDVTTMADETPVMVPRSTVDLGYCKPVPRNA